MTIYGMLPICLHWYYWHSGKPKGSGTVQAVIVVNRLYDCVFPHTIIA